MADEQRGNGGQEARQDQQHDADAASSSSPWHWAVAAAGAVLVLAVVAFLVYEITTTPAQPLPHVAIAVDSIVTSPGGYQVRFVARNTGSGTAAALHVEGVLRDGDRVLEQHTAVLDYLPAGSERRGGLFFTRDPRTGQLELRPAAYAAP